MAENDKTNPAAAAAQNAKPGVTQVAKPEGKQDGKLKMGKGLLTISGPEGGRRRAGYSFGKEPVEIDASKLTEDQVEALLADPLLSVKQGK